MPGRGSPSAGSSRSTGSTRCSGTAPTASSWCGRSPRPRIQALRPGRSPSGLRLASSNPVADTWTTSLWHSVEPIYAAIIEHPFITGLTDGSLSEDSFAYYVAQDAHYLRDYARALAVVGAKAPTHADAAMFGRHAAETAEVEMALHETLLPQLGIDPERLDAIPASPTTTAYTSYL